jgi:hypothetical protein
MESTASGIGGEFPSSRVRGVCFREGTHGCVRRESVIDFMRSFYRFSKYSRPAAHALTRHAFH